LSSKRIVYYEFIPSAGPQTMAMEYPARAIPLHSAEYKSPKTPPVFVMGAEAKNAPKNRVSMMV
jgi:hypothetical protein